MFSQSSFEALSVFLRVDIGLLSALLNIFSVQDLEPGEIFLIHLNPAMRQNT
jgi:hypothetical protein